VGTEGFQVRASRSGPVKCGKLTKGSMSMRSQEPSKGDCVIHYVLGGLRSWNNLSLAQACNMLLHCTLRSP